MKKRVILLVVSMIAVMSVFVLMCFAADVELDADTLYDIEFYVEDAAAGHGDTKIDVGIDIKRNPGLAGIVYEIEYDDQVFTLSGEPVLGTITDVKADAFGEKKSPHMGVLSTPDGKSMLGNGRLLTYTFDIGQSAAAGTYDITIRLSGVSENGTELKVLNDRLEKIDAVIYNGSITIPGYTVRFDANGGEGEPGDITKTHGMDIMLPSDKPAREGYDFLGWAQDKNAAEAQFEAGGAFNVNADTVLYAVWKKQPLSADTLELTLTAGRVNEVEVSDGVFEKRVIVTVSATQNPGFSAIEFNLDYDKTKLQYVSSEQAAAGPVFVAPVTGEDPFSLIYVSATEHNFKKETELLNITFKVLDNAPTGDVPVRIVPNKDLCKYFNGTADMPLKVAVNDTVVTIGTPQLLGDINLDGTVDISDAIYLFQYSMIGEEYYPMNYKGNIDFAKDGSVDINDAIYLFQYSMIGGDYYPIEW